MARNVIGQTGTLVLSDATIQLQLDKKRTVRYQYTKVRDGWIAWICGPFHSRTYGVIGFGTRKLWAKDALSRNLANNYGYIGNMIFSDVDESDTVGKHTISILDDRKALPITMAEAHGSAGI